MQPRCIAYIALAGDDRIASLVLDGDTGGLEPLADLEIAGGPGPLALSPDGSRMYAALRDSREACERRNREVTFWCVCSG